MGAETPGSECPGGSNVRAASHGIERAAERVPHFFGEDGVWSVSFGPVHLGWLDERDYRIMDVKEKSRRRR